MHYSNFHLNYTVNQYAYIFVDHDLFCVGVDKYES